MRKLIAGLAVLLSTISAQGAEPLGEAVRTVVIIYDENRAFDHLFGTFPGADGISRASPEQVLQVDRDGQPLKRLPQVWGGGRHGKPAFPQDLPNRPFVINGPPVNIGLEAIIPSPVHEFYKNRMQINGGLNNMFAAWSSQGGLTQGHYRTRDLHLWRLAREYTLADRFFQGAFGGSFLNHFWLVCACTPEIEGFDGLDEALKARYNSVRAVLDANGNLAVEAGSPSSALEGPPHFVPASLTPKDQPVAGRTYAINTLYPPYQPSAVAPAEDGDPRFADLDPPRGRPPLTPQTATNIGDLLTERGVSWAWYAEAWDKALENPGQVQKQPTDLFQPHHQPFNYFARYAPGTAARARHLKDLDQDFWPALKAGALPQVVFIKPAGRYDEHAGYSSLTTADAELYEIVKALQASPQWDRMVIIITYDENGGFWDHVAPPSGDYWGPGSRIPAVIVSPYARRGHVDHTQYDTTSILRFIALRFGVDEHRLPGIREGAGDIRGAFDPEKLIFPP